MENVLNIIKTANITLPAAEWGLLLIIMTYCLVFHMTRVGLIAAYLFSYRWGWLLFAERDEKFLTTYLVLGVIIGIITSVGIVFVKQYRED